MMKIRIETLFMEYNFDTANMLAPYVMQLTCQAHLDDTSVLQRRCINFTWLFNLSLVANMIGVLDRLPPTQLATR